MRWLSLGLTILLAGCAIAGGADSGGRTSLRLGYFPNVTHATAIAGLERGILADALGSDVELRSQAFNAGPEVVEAIFSGALDAAYIGPNPAINAYARSAGQAIRIIAGATSGGAALVVRSGIDTVDDLRGTTLATPQLGNTQDVALRAWLNEQGLAANLEGGGDVSVRPQANGDALQAFVTGSIDGAWVPEPWATRMVQEGRGHVLVDERDLWPGGRFVTTDLIVTTQFLSAHPEIVKRLLIGHVEATDWVNQHPAEAQSTVGKAIADLTDATLPASTLETAWHNLTFTVDPIASSLQVTAQHAEQLGLLDRVNLDGIHDLTLLNEVLRERGAREVGE